MDVNAKNVEALATRKQAENYDLRRYLKEQDELSAEELDQLAADVTRRVWATFDCTTCANCCKELGRSVTDKEAQRLAAGLGLSAEDFRRRYLEGRVGPAEEDSEDGGDEARWRLRGKPCPFLKDNRCTVYEARPEQCRKYPYLCEPNFSSRTLGMIERTFTCPVVYRVLEELKAELPFRRLGRRREPW
jgi:uncharacterized protein